MELQNKQMLDSLIKGELENVIENIVGLIPNVLNKDLKLRLCLVCFDFYDLQKRSSLGILTNELVFLEKRKIVNRLFELMI